MKQTTPVKTPIMNNTASSAFASAQERLDRIQVSCISEEDDMSFLSPRPFSFARKEQAHANWLSQKGADQDFQHTDDIINYAVRSIRRVGYALILASVLLLVIDGILRNTFGL